MGLLAGSSVEGLKMTFQDLSVLRKLTFGFTDVSYTHTKFDLTIPITTPLRRRRCTDADITELSPSFC